MCLWGAGAHGGQEKSLVPLELELRVAMNFPVWI